MFTELDIILLLVIELYEVCFKQNSGSVNTFFISHTEVQNCGAPDVEISHGVVRFISMLIITQSSQIN